ncbi:2998_t:CDS:2 [Cetraspora pellucida]|uniref:2998_t:CDS:1 n=1 Tax=Cetraspora pellucida TaxID=1433469 RepID=A0A9N9PF50_9GLOM|nr:2998_t:CDS:2 [Cetraspora pellucida]
MRKDRFDFLVDYIAEFNRIQQGIQNETEIERLKDFWFFEITKSKLENDDKQKLNELKEECIRELEQTQPGTNDFNHIRDGICYKKEIPNLEVNRCWFREIRNSRNLSEEQKVALNIQHDEKLKALSNEKYNKINEEIPKIETAAEIYKDNEYDQYFIDKSNNQFHSIYKIEDVDEFVNNIIKKNYLYKTIKEIFDQENNVITFSKIVEPNDNKQFFFKKIRPLVKNQEYLNKIDKILEKDDLDDVTDNKKQKQTSRRMKKIKEDINMIIPKTQSFLM